MKADGCPLALVGRGHMGEAIAGLILVRLSVQKPDRWA